MSIGDIKNGMDAVKEGVSAAQQGAEAVKEGVDIAKQGAEILKQGAGAVKKRAEDFVKQGAHDLVGQGPGGFTHGADMLKQGPGGFTHGADMPKQAGDFTHAVDPLKQSAGSLSQTAGAGTQVSGASDIAGVFGGLLSHQAVFELEVDGASFNVVRFSGHESISGLYQFAVEVAAIDVDMDALLGQAALLTLHGIQTPRLVHGFVAEAEYVGQTPSMQLYTIVVMPALHRLMHRSSCRVFQKKTTQEIVTEVALKAVLKREWFRFDLIEKLAPRDYCVQYRESDLAFVSRLLEEDGIYYRFEHETDKHVWVLADSPQAHPPIVGEPTLSFANALGNVQRKEHVRGLRFGGRVRTGAVKLRDFNLHKPDLGLEVHEAGKLDADLEVYEFPGEYQDPGRGSPHQGQSMAKNRLDAIESGRRSGSGHSDCPRLAAGSTVKVVDHPKLSLNIEYRIMQVYHTGQQPQVLGQDAAGGESSYINSFTVTALEAPFRPARRTPRPVMRGVQTATVVGPADEEVHTDEHGRVRVQFHWDREGKHDENCTTWVRVSQAWAGNGYGTMFLPRIGHEVLVDFIEGDPDRPIIIGRIYHGLNKPPYPLPDEKTKSTIKSESSLGGGGYNELSFEDHKGSEEIALRAQKDWNTTILNNLGESVGANRSATIGANDSTTVGAVHTVTIAQASDPPPASPPTGTKMQDTFFSVTSGTARITINGSDIFIVADGNIALSAGGNISISSGGAIDIGSAASTFVNAGEGVLDLKGPLIKLNCADE